MSWYEQHVMNRIIEVVLGTSGVTTARREALAPAQGTVLEVGMGTGLNLLAYPPAVRAVTAVTRDPELHPLAATRASQKGIAVEHLQGDGEQLPCADGSIDTVVSTFLFCSIPNAEAVAREYLRVLRPDGRLIFLEHVRAPTRTQRAVQRIMDLPSRAVLCGCSLVRDTPAVLQTAGFALERLECFQVPKLPWTHSYLASGLARPNSLA